MPNKFNRLFVVMATPIKECEFKYHHDCNVSILGNVLFDNFFLQEEI